LYTRNKIQNTGQYYPNRAYKRNDETNDEIIITNKRRRENEILNNLPVKKPGNNFENNRGKHLNLADSYGEISNII
ncbi:hypothetical protein H8356DRAFT_918628, partial [Neocallimastix lanati (nom. inval.)]